MSKNLFQQAYEAIKFNRNLVDNKTTIQDRLMVFREETKEANKALYECVDSNKLSKEAVHELIDVIIVCVVTIIHFGWDMLKEFKENILHQKTRLD